MVMTIAMNINAFAPLPRKKIVKKLFMHNVKRSATYLFGCSQMPDTVSFFHYGIPQLRIQMQRNHLGKTYSTHPQNATAFPKRRCNI